jgi:hypothetical protein
MPRRSAAPWRVARWSSSATSSPVGSRARPRPPQPSRPPSTARPASRGTTPRPAKKRGRAPHPTALGSGRGRGGLQPGNDRLPGRPMDPSCRCRGHPGGDGEPERDALPGHERERGRGEPKRLMEWVRGHWSVENGLHFIRDRWWDEDRQWSHCPGLAECLATMRDAALTVLRLIPGVPDDLPIRARADHLGRRLRKAPNFIGARK